jgi:hypothetical protein
LERPEEFQFEETGHNKKMVSGWLKQVRALGMIRITALGKI